jgi:hypothetical protein
LAYAVYAVYLADFMEWFCKQRERSSRYQCPVTLRDHVNLVKKDLKKIFKKGDSSYGGMGERHHAFPRERVRREPQSEKSLQSSLFHPFDPYHLQARGVASHQGNRAGADSEEFRQEAKQFGVGFSLNGRSLYFDLESIGLRIARPVNPADNFASRRVRGGLDVELDRHAAGV